MDEITLAFARRIVRMHLPVVAAMAVGSIGFGLVAPRSELPDIAAPLAMLAAWVALSWLAADRETRSMDAVLAAPRGRRGWLLAHQIAASACAAIVAGACLAPEGARPALTAGLVALVYGGMLSTVGSMVMLIPDRPKTAAWAGGALLWICVVTVGPHGIGVAWHPFALLREGIARGLGDEPRATLPMLWQGAALPLVGSLAALRGSLRSVDRLETLG